MPYRYPMDRRIVCSSCPVCQTYADVAVPLLVCAVAPQALRWQWPPPWLWAPWRVRWARAPWWSQALGLPPPFNGFPACPDGNEVQAAMHAFQADRALTLRGGMGDHRLPSGILRPASQDLAETLDVADAWRCAGELGKSRG